MADNEWPDPLPDQQLYSLLVPDGFDPYDILIFWISAYPNLGRPCFFITDPFYFVQRSNQTYDAFKDFRMPFSPDRILATWAQYPTGEEHVLYFESIFLLRQLLQNSTEMVEFLREHRQWKILVLLPFPIERADIAYVEQILDTNQITMRTNIRPAHNFQTGVIAYEDLRLWLSVLSFKVVLVTDANKLSELGLNYSRSYVYSARPAPEGMQRWGLDIESWLTSPVADLLITDATQLPSLAGVTHLIIDRPVTSLQYLALLSALNIPTFNAWTINIKFVNRYPERLNAELIIQQKTFNELLNNAQFVLSSNGRRRIKIEAI